MLTFGTYELYKTALLGRFPVRHAQAMVPAYLRVSATFSAPSAASLFVAAIYIGAYVYTKSMTRFVAVHITAAGVLDKVVNASTIRRGLGMWVQIKRSSPKG